MPSLKAYIPRLSERLAISPAALYERQRALVRAGLLHPETGRGPGSGVQATVPSIALMLIAVLSTDSLSHTDVAARAVAASEPKSGDCCSLTGAKTFLDALAIVVGRGDELIEEVGVSRTSDLARIVYRDSDGMRKVSEFGSDIGRAPGIQVDALIEGAIFPEIFVDMLAMIWKEGQERGDADDNLLINTRQVEPMLPDRNQTTSDSKQ